MNTKIYELSFHAGVHFGDGDLTDSDYAFSADTLFSALFIEALKKDLSVAEMLKQRIDTGKISFSDALPRIKERMFLPKPFYPIQRGGYEGNSSVKKQIKNMRYIPYDCIDDFLKGQMDLRLAADLSDLGKSEIRAATAVRGVDEPLPYGIGVFRFFPDCGLNIILKYETSEDKTLFEELLRMLGNSGIGGKKSSGLGTFSVSESKDCVDLAERINKKEGLFMSLSVSLPVQEEMDGALKHTWYVLRRRSGYVYSEDYAPEQRRRRDLYVFAAGACTDLPYHGFIADVSHKGKHPVYRYAVPLWMGVNV